MAKKHEWKLDDLTDSEIRDAIRYLDRNSGCTHRKKTDKSEDDTVLIVCVSLLVLVLGCLGFVFLYYR